MVILYRRCRALKPGISKFQVVQGTLTTGPNDLNVDLINTETSHLYTFQLQTLQSSTFRIEINEKTPLKARHRVEDSLKGTPVPKT